MIKVSPTSSIKDTLKKHEAIDSISNLLANSNTLFGELAEEVLLFLEMDKSVKDSSMLLKWFILLKMHLYYNYW